MEQAFGRLKGRWRIMDGPCKVSNPVLVRKVAIVCCALYYICERIRCPFEPVWLPEESAYVHTTPAQEETRVNTGIRESCDTEYGITTGGCIQRKKMLLCNMLRTLINGLRARMRSR